ncbi:MAG: hypothetical protein GVY29_03955 [Spirochaetes bacterium]|jgi:hypothetical protein|nr:hypothetical protein [Spirochaetota bacterium]
MGDQTESPHYFAKRRLPLRAVWATLAGGACLREVAVRYGVSPMAIQNGVVRLGRQAMAAQAHLLAHLNPRSELCFDGLRSFVSSQDYPCDITTVVDRPGETVLSMTHTITRRGGTMRPAQTERNEAKMAVWKPAAGTMTRDISLVIDEIWDYLRPCAERPAIIDTDEHPIYKAQLDADPRARHFAAGKLFRHNRTPGSAPRTQWNPLFPVNYVDRLLRHREKEHMRETIAFGRHTTIQMHRAWLFAWDHNARRPWRVRQSTDECHATHGTPKLPAAVAPEPLSPLGAQFFTRRIRLLGCAVPRSIRKVWMAQLPTPPVRWRRGQAGTTVHVPAYAVRDLDQAYQQAC